MEIHVVKQGDTVDTIAAFYGVSPASVIYDNQLAYPYALAVGQALLISTSPVSEPTFSAYSGGYAYPFIEEMVLQETLPFLSYLFIFSYGFTTEGELVPPTLDDQFMIQWAYRLGARPILTLTPFGPDGMFNNYLITTMVNDEVVKNRLFQNLLAAMNEKGFQGVDVDFEYILSADRVPFADFVADLKSFLAPYGYTVSVALAPKTSDDQPGLLYEGKDYGLLGNAADWVLLMTYEWGYTYGPPMAVAPINKVIEVVNYAVTRIDPSKIHRGIPDYGCDWPLPYEKGVTTARTISNTEAVQIAIRAGVPILFDETAMSPYFTYTENGIRHEVWFEDVRSLTEKYSLLPSYQLRGISIWQIMKLFRPAFLLFQDMLRIQKF